MKSIFSITKDLRKRSEKFNKFTNTYLRCFHPNDTKKVIFRNHLGNFVNSIILGPVPLAISGFFPYKIFYSEFESLPFIYEFPGYMAVYLISREVFGNLSFRSDLKFKQKLYEKYQPEMDLTKDDIEELEYEQKMRLKIEEGKSKNAAESVNNSTIKEKN